MELKNKRIFRLITYRNGFGTINALIVLGVCLIVMSTGALFISVAGKGSRAGSEQLSMIVHSNNFFSVADLVVENSLLEIYSETLIWYKENRAKEGLTNTQEINRPNEIVRNSSTDVKGELGALPDNLNDAVDIKLILNKIWKELPKINNGASVHFNNYQTLYKDVAEIRSGIFRFEQLLYSKDKKHFVSKEASENLIIESSEEIGFTLVFEGTTVEGKKITYRKYYYLNIDEEIFGLTEYPIGKGLDFGEVQYVQR